jgi:winged helix DNA-binding protein
MPGRSAAKAAAGAATQPAEPISQRALNRALLARQLLLHRSPTRAVDAIGHLVGMQAQVPLQPYFGLWSRLDGFVPSALAELITQRHVVRVALMRNTVHLVTAADCLTLRPLIQPVMDRDLRGNTTYTPKIAGLDLTELAAAGRTAVEEEPRTGKQLGLLLMGRWPDRDPTALVWAVRDLLPLVQVPPRGVWGSGGLPTLTTAECWLDRPLAGDPSIDHMVLRYLAAFGPASVMDAQTWCGLTRLREVFERLRPQLRTFRGENGRELFDLPDAPRPHEETPAQPRFLPEYDNLLLSHADRSRVVSDTYRKRFASPNGVGPGSVLVDGTVRAMWTLNREDGTAVLQIRLLEQLPAQARAAVGEEGARLLSFAAADAADHDIQLTQPE